MLDEGCETSREKKGEINNVSLPGSSGQSTVMDPPDKPEDDILGGPKGTIKIAT